jgi:hypothetical protein
MEEMRRGEKQNLQSETANPDPISSGEIARARNQIIGI